MQSVRLRNDKKIDIHFVYVQVISFRTVRLRNDKKIDIHFVYVQVISFRSVALIVSLFFFFFSLCV